MRVANFEQKAKYDNFEHIKQISQQDLYWF